MIRPKIPVMPQPTGLITPPAVEPTSVIQQPTTAHAPVAPVTASARPTFQLTPGAVVALIGGGTAVVLVVGAVLVSMLLAVAITGASLAICALVIRSLINTEAKRR
ncbi:SpdD-like protein [Streptomyces sp. NPDC088360]|uniref:SpdD-like protein n=1 Tax=Streptomyces sp. NPDC088360 TaxID=3154515 RepID=UPI00344B48C3